MNYLKYLIVIFITGFCSLVYQVIWQRYLSLLLGSEAKSATIVISIFLLGLSLGNYLFGKLSSRIESRQQLLKIYGYVELATGLYLVLFSSFFSFVSSRIVGDSGNYFLQFFASFLLVFPASILMGATVPIMTSVIPDKGSNINEGHKLIYGINSIGAFLGVVVSALFIIPVYGLEIGGLIIGGLNIIVSFIYLANSLKGNISKKELPDNIQSNLSNKFLLLLSFISGLCIISLEVIWIRLWGLTIGTSVLIFPMVISIFIFGIGHGSLTTKSISLKSLIKTLYVGILGLVGSFVVVPYIPLWIGNIRVLLVNHEVNFYIFYILSYLILGLIILPFCIPLGRILPLCYGLMKKRNDKFGEDCGILYGINTLGTFTGSIFLGYFALYFIDIDSIYKITIILLVLSAIYILKKERKLKDINFLVLILIVLIPFTWHRSLHIYGTFRERVVTKHHFKGMFNIGRIDVENVDFFEDGPNTTVAVTRSTLEDKSISKSIMVNGKSDSSTYGDYPTIHLLSLFPYLIHEDTSLSASIIGIGTGVSAGFMGKFEEINNVDVVEISSSVIKSQKYFSPENFDLLNNKKVKIYNNDAFRFYVNKKSAYDIIMSEPTNPWVVGVENLYTTYFYKIIDESLKEKGLFVQWIHSYSMNQNMFVTIIKNLKEVFKFIEIYRTNDLDLAILASNDSFQFNKVSRIKEAYISPVLSKINLSSMKDLGMLKVLSNEDIEAISLTLESSDHSIFHPTLSYRALYSFFIGEKLDLKLLVDPYFSRLINSPNILTSEIINMNEDCANAKSYNLQCLDSIKFYRSNLSQYSKGTDKQKIISYSILRKEKVIGKDIIFLNNILKNNYKDKDVIRMILKEYLKEGEYNIAKTKAKALFSKNIISRIVYDSLLAQIKGLRETLANYKKEMGI